MKIDELKKKKKEELQELLGEQREKKRELRFQLVSKQLKDVRALRLAKRDVARILTLLNQESPDMKSGQAGIMNKGIEKEVVTDNKKQEA